MVVVPPEEASAEAAGRTYVEMRGMERWSFRLTHRRPMVPTLFDWIRETHTGPEPRVLTSCVQEILREIIRPEDEDSGRSVALIAERACVSPRTVYRVLNPAPRDDGLPPTISLDLADRLCLAADSHLRHTLLYWPDGSVSSYEAL